MTANSDMEQLFELQQQQREKERNALDAEVEASRENFRQRVSAAQRDPVLNIEVNDES